MSDWGLKYEEKLRGDPTGALPNSIELETAKKPSATAEELYAVAKLFSEHKVEVRERAYYTVAGDPTERYQPNLDRVNYDYPERDKCVAYAERARALGCLRSTELLGQYYLSKKHHEKALDYFSECLIKEKNSPTAYYNMAVAYSHENVAIAEAYYVLAYLAGHPKKLPGKYHKYAEWMRPDMAVIAEPDLKVEFIRFCLKLLVFGEGLFEEKAGFLGKFPELEKGRDEREKLGFLLASLCSGPKAFDYFLEHDKAGDKKSSSSAPLVSLVKSATDELKAHLARIAEAYIESLRVDFIPPNGRPDALRALQIYESFQQHKEAISSGYFERAARAHADLASSRGPEVVAAVQALKGAAAAVPSSSPAGLEAGLFPAARAIDAKAGSIPFAPQEAKFKF